MEMSKKPAVDKSKILSIRFLFLVSVVIIVLGALFCIYSFMFNVNIRVVQTNVSGVFFGLVVLYLGIWYLLRVRKLKKEVYKSESGFSWSNFKIERKKAHRK